MGMVAVRISLVALLLTQFTNASAGNDLGACQADAMIVFDASGSMATSDLSLKAPRIAHLKQAMARVLPEVAPFRRLGLIVYGEGAYNDCGSIALRMRPTSDAAAPMLRIIQAINPRGRTPLTESVREAAEVLDYTHRPSVVVLVTDGEETCGQDPCKAAVALKQAGHDLTVHVIGYRDVQQQGYFTARCLADTTGGQYVSASNEEELVKALRKTLGCPLLTDVAQPPGQRFACAMSPSRAVRSFAGGTRGSP